MRSVEAALFTIFRETTIRSMNRRNALKLAVVSPTLALSDKIRSNKSSMDVRNSMKHSISRWCYGSTDIHTLIKWCKELGISSIELLDKEEYEIVLDAGLDCAVVNGSKLGITKGFNNPSLHAQLLNDYSVLIPEMAKAGLKTIITFSGNRNGMSDEEGLANCVKGLKPVVRLAEEHGIMVIMELLNSYVDHADYMCDHTEWGVDLVDALGSDHFRLLYDIYHMQIMEGNVVNNIKKYSDYIAHYHSGGVPGRNEINENQELNYPFIIKSIIETGYDGFLGQEFVPSKENAFDSLKEAIQICS